MFMMFLGQVLDFFWDLNVSILEKKINKFLIFTQKN